MVCSWYEGGGDVVKGAIGKEGTEYLPKAAQKTERLERSIIEVDAPMM